MRVLCVSLLDGLLVCWFVSLCLVPVICGFGWCVDAGGCCHGIAINSVGQGVFAVVLVLFWWLSCLIAFWVVDCYCCLFVIHIVYFGGLVVYAVILSLALLVGLVFVPRRWWG